jgi:hypothetical protein
LCLVYLVRSWVGGGSLLVCLEPLGTYPDDGVVGMGRHGVRGVLYQSFCHKLAIFVFSVSLVDQARVIVKFVSTIFDAVEKQSREAISGRFHCGGKDELVVCYFCSGRDSAQAWSWRYQHWQGPYLRTTAPSPGLTTHMAEDVLHALIAVMGSYSRLAPELRTHCTEAKTTLNMVECLAVWGGQRIASSTSMSCYALQRRARRCGGFEGRNLVSNVRKLRTL